MKLNELFDRPERGNPTPLRGVALCFEDGRARVMVQGPCADDWVELLSAPTSTEGLACAVDLTQPQAVLLNVGHFPIEKLGKKE